MSTKQRLSSGESREAALDAARAILIESGPQAVTLKAVASRMGRTHANLLHHFGSAAALQKALGERLADSVTARIAVAVAAARAGRIGPEAVVAMAFDAFEGEGGGALVGWMLLSGQDDALAPVIAAIARLADGLKAAEPERSGIAEQLLSVTIAAMGHSLIGTALSRALGLDDDAGRAGVTQALVGAIAYADAPDVRAAIARWIAARPAPPPA